AGNVTFTPDALYTLDPPVIEYTIQDDEGNVSNEATITFDYEPIAINDVSDNGGLGHPINTDVTVDVLANDITGDTYDPTTVSLVDPGTAINIVTDLNGDITSFEIPGEGTWNVDLVTGEITFNPADGFILSPTPIEYNVEDDEGNQSNDALVTIIYIAQADIQVVKTDNSDTYTPGLPIVYTITVTNNGPANTADVIVNDDIIDPVLEAVTTWTGNGSTDVSGDIANDIIATLNVGDIVTYTVTINVPSGYVGDIVNTAIVALPPSTDFTMPVDPDPSNNTSTDVDEMDAQAALVVNKTVDNPTPEVGSEVIFTIDVINNGPSDATGIDVVDYLPSGYSFVSASTFTGSYDEISGLWDLGNLVFDATATLEITAVVNATGDYTNFAEVAYADQDDPNSIHGNNDPNEDDQDEALTIPNSVANLVTSKTVDNNTPNIGDTINYTLTVVNNGPSIATGVSVTDNIPVGLTYVSHIAVGGDLNTYSGGIWNIGTIDIGDSASLVLTVIVNDDQGGNTINNIITDVSLNEIDPNLTGDDFVESITVTSSDLVTEKTVSNPTPNEGDTIIYTISVTNNGPSDATNVSLIDNLPVGVTYLSHTLTEGFFNSGSGEWLIQDLANGAIASLEISALVNAGTGGTVITNFTSPAEGDQSDPDTTTDDLEALITVIDEADILLTKVVDNATPNEGDTVTYTVTVTNNGLAAVTNLVIDDTLPVGLTYGTVTPSIGNWIAPYWEIGILDSGVTESITIEAIVGEGTRGLTLTNVVSNTQDQVDSNNTPDDDSETIVVTSVDLVTTKTVSDAEPNEGDVVTYTITVTNTLGGSDATNVNLTENLPVGVTYVSHTTANGVYNEGSGLWSIGDVTSGESVVLLINASVDDGTVGQTITNTTSNVTADQADYDTSNNSGSVSIVPVAIIDLSLTKWVVDDVVNPEVGDMITFEIRVLNDGPTEATGVEVTDLIPSGYDFVNYSSSIGTYNPISGLWNIGFIEVGNTAVLLVDVIVLDSGDYINCAEITAANEDDIDSTPNNSDVDEDDYDCASAPPIQELDLRVEKTVIADNLTPMVGTEVSFEIRLINHGIIEGTEVVVTDLLPTGYTFLNYSSTRGTYDDDSGKWIVGTIVDGETEVLVIDAIVNATGDYLNCATITEMHQTDTDLSNNTSCIATSPIKIIDLELTKEVALSLGNEGPVSTTGVLQPYAETNVDFTITVSNNGPSDATGVQVTDLLPNGYNFVDATVSMGTYNDGSGIWNIGTIAIGASETLIITAYVNPVGNWLNVAEVTAANELDIDSTPNNGDIFEDDMDQIATEPIIPLTIPEGFTPNGDGINDVFEIEFLEVLYPNFGMEIVNRYGNKVYEYKHDGNPYQTPQWWDGYSTGRWNFTNDELPAGTYFYTIYFNNDERKPQTGWVYLRK
ncbi:MAG: DUF11 domain-containing protein, partial [Lutibacter sp.]|uniref:T9SS type B sorting domain-containing protein n=1 Tax=Lutibacter sp. TaxID=1925666 RepID=UPI00183278C0